MNKYKETPTPCGHQEATEDLGTGYQAPDVGRRDARMYRGEKTVGDEDKGHLATFSTEVWPQTPQQVETSHEELLQSPHIL